VTKQRKRGRRRGRRSSPSPKGRGVDSEIPLCL